MSLDFGADIPFVRELGFELQRFGGGEAELHWTPRPEHLNSFAVTHGGGVMTLMDVTMAAAARSAQPELGLVTIEMKTSFMQPCVGPLRGVGQLMHRTKSTAFVQASVLNAEGTVCAHATGTFRYVVRRPPQTEGGPQGNLPTD